MTKPQVLKPASVAEIHSLVGDLDNDAILAIWRTEATPQDIMQALRPVGEGYWNSIITQTGGQPYYTQAVRAVQEILDAYAMQDEEIT